MMLGWAKGLSTRSANALIFAGYTSKEQLHADVLAHPMALLKLPNIGRKAIDEISTWLEIMNPQLQRRIESAKAFLESNGYMVTAKEEE